MGVSGGVDELTWFQTANLGDHHGQEGIGSDIERDAEEGIRAALVELARQFPVSDIKLEQAMARRKSHLVDLSGIPCGDEDPAGIGIVLDSLHNLGQLVY